MFWHVTMHVMTHASEYNIRHKIATNNVTFDAMFNILLCCEFDVYDKNEFFLDYINLKQFF